MRDCLQCPELFGASLVSSIPAFTIDNGLTSGQSDGGSDRVAESKSTPGYGQQAKRILSVMPNFNSVSAGTQLPSQSFKGKLMNASEDNEGLGANWATRRGFWADRPGYEMKSRTNLLSLAKTKTRHVGDEPDLWTDEYAFLNAPEQAQIQIDLFCDYRTNVDSYPKWQTWIQKEQPRLLLIWRKHDLSFDLGSRNRSLAKSANMIGAQSFTGKLGGRDGTFVLQCKETAENGKIKATWFVVPGSGTVNFPGFRAKEVLKANLEKGLTDGRIIGSKEAVYECKDNADQVTFGSI